MLKSSFLKSKYLFAPAVALACIGCRRAAIQNFSAGEITKLYMDHPARFQNLAGEEVSVTGEILWGQFYASDEVNGNVVIDAHEKDKFGNTWRVCFIFDASNRNALSDCFDADQVTAVGKFIHFAERSSEIQFQGSTIVKISSLSRSKALRRVGIIN